MPQLARDFMAHIKRRQRLDAEPMSGGSYADRHLAETGHPFERGCCMKPYNRCAGCRQTLPREAKIRNEVYCSKACREAAQR